MENQYFGDHCPLLGGGGGIPDIVQTGVGDVPIKVHKQYNWNLDIFPIGVENVPMKVHRQSN
jgi:hypothetical protein